MVLRKYGHGVLEAFEAQRVFLESQSEGWGRIAQECTLQRCPEGWWPTFPYVRAAWKGLNELDPELECELTACSLEFGVFSPVGDVLSLCGARPYWTSSAEWIKGAMQKKTLNPKP